MIISDFETQRALIEAQRGLLGSQEMIRVRIDVVSKLEDDSDSVFYELDNEWLKVHVLGNTLHGQTVCAIVDLATDGRVFDEIKLWDHFSSHNLYIQPWFFTDIWIMTTSLKALIKGLKAKFESYYEPNSCDDNIIDCQKLIEALPRPYFIYNYSEVGSEYRTVIFSDDNGWRKNQRNALTSSGG